MPNLKSFITLTDTRNGITYDISQLVSDLSISSNLRLQPSTCEFTLIARNIDFQPGAVVVVTLNDVRMFQGIVFTKDRTRFIKEIKVKCYDYLRYFQNHSFYKAEDETCAQTFLKLAKMSGLEESRYKVIDTPSYKVKTQYYENKSYLDILKERLDYTLAYGKELFFIHQSGDCLELRNVENCVLPYMLGTKAGIMDLKYQTSIDKGVYTQVVLYRDDLAKQTRYDAVVKNSNRQKEWGLLRMYKKQDEGMSVQEASTKAESMLKLYGKVRRTLSLSCLGQPDVYAGCILYIKELNLGDIILQDQKCLITSCTHRIQSNLHTMELQLNFRYPGDENE